MVAVDSDLVSELARHDEYFTARELLRTQRLEGNVVLWTFQNPEEVVRLPEEGDE